MSETDAKVAPPEEPPLPDALVLGGAFPAATREQWRAEVAKVLAKRGPAPDDVEDALSTDVAGLRVRPLHTAADAPASALRPTRAGGWDVRARQAHPDPRTAAAQALEDLEGGAGSLWLVVGEGGVPVDGIAAALEGVLLDLAAVAVDAGALFAVAADAALAAGVQRGTLGADPVAVLARTGALPEEAAAYALAARCAGTGVRAMTVDALPFHEAGATAAQELALSLSAAVHYLRAGVAPDQLEFRFAATADQFLTIAGLRAARRLWARVLEASGLPDAPQVQHAVTSWSMTTTRDPYVSVLRGTTACFAAGVGGADSVTVLPFDAALGQPDALARRIARNTSALLVEESHVAAVTDPAGGSWYVERLTDDLAQAAWAAFQDVERAGGVVAGLQDGSVAALLEASRTAQLERLAHRTAAVTGVSEFPFLDEKPVVREPAPALPGGGLPRVRWAERHEALRDRADRHLAATGRRPTVLAVTTGAVRTHVARLDYVRNLLAPGGVVVDAVDRDDLPAQVPPVVVLVAADDVAPDEALVEALRSRGATRVLRAGRGRDWPVDGYVFVGCDALAVLQQTADDLGVAP